ncbi:Centromere protein O [Apodemus speciosus]|uniref:Centromere protein O n=1 Tax=Apodemus speciosus TaxID=105296 RepID=A0ABQ0FDD9_APOSI
MLTLPCTSSIVRKTTENPKRRWSLQILCGQAESAKEGVLAHLERLETQTNRKSEEPTAREKESSLRTKIRKLQQQREKLRAEVKRRRARSFLCVALAVLELTLASNSEIHLLLPHSTGIKGPAWIFSNTIRSFSVCLVHVAQTYPLKRSMVKDSSAKEDPSKTVISEQEVLEKQWRNVKAILQAYRFTGLSGKLTSRGVCVYLSTAFEGNLLESYFVDLVIAKPLRIHHHSIPVFIPLEKIATAHLQTDVQRFLFSLWECLNAYVGRKYQADQLESDFCAFLTGPLQRNTLCNLLSFSYKVTQGRQTFSFSARLLYEDLTAALPTDVTVTRPGVEASSPHWEEHRASHEMLFRTKPLHQVFASFSKETEKLDLSLVS